MKRQTVVRIEEAEHKIITTELKKRKKSFQKYVMELIRKDMGLIDGVKSEK